MFFPRTWLVALISSVILAGAACTANLEEGCLAGQCSPPGMPPIPSNSSSSGAGGAGGSSCGTTPATGDFPCDVFMALQTNCHPCHQNPPMNGAPFSLLTYEDTREIITATGTPRWKRMGEVIESGFMPLGQTISDPDKQTLLDWINACALPPESMGCE